MPGAIRILFIISLLFVFSCANKKKIVYFQGDKSVNSDTINGFSAKLRIDDLLSIVVMGMDAEAVKPFNLSTYGQFVGQQENPGTSSQTASGYLIDKNGDIEFPIIGRIKLSGLTRVEASQLIKSKLTDYLKEPIVNIRILNYKFTILGDVNKPGVYTIPNERITLIEAIGLAGDLNLSGMRKNILVIRDVEGKKTETRVDLTTKDVFNSPVYYLQQNDVIYVEQNRPKKNSSVVNSTGITLVLSSVTFLITLITLITAKH